MQRAVKYLRLVSDALNMRLEQDEKGSRVVVKGSTIEAPQLRHTEILVAHQVIRQQHERGIVAELHGRHPRPRPRDAADRVDTIDCRLPTAPRQRPTRV